MDDITKSRVLKVVQKVTGARTEDLYPEDGDLKSELVLNSIQMVQLIAELEKEFEIDLPPKMMTVKSSTEFMEMLEEKIGN